MPRAPRSSDLYDLRVPLDVALSPDGAQVCFTVKSVSPKKDGYRLALWLAPTDGSTPARQLTLGATREFSPRWSPDGRTLAFLADREGVLIRAGAGPDAGVSEPPSEGAIQVWLMPMDGGEPRQLTSLPQDMADLQWSPDGRHLCVVSGARRADRSPSRRKPSDPPERDMHLVDRLGYMLNAAGYIYRHPPKLWLIDVASGDARRLTSGPSRDEEPAWSPNGRTIAFSSDRHRDPDLRWRRDIYAVDVVRGTVRRVTGGRGDRIFGHPAWSPDGRWLAAIGHRAVERVSKRSDVWRFRATGDHVGENLTGDSDLEVEAAVNSDLFGFAVTPPAWSADGQSIVFAAPADGSCQAWRVHVAERRVERLTTGEHYLSRLTILDLPASGQRGAAILADAVTPPEVATFDIPRSAVASRGVKLRRVSNLMTDMWRDIRLTAPVSRWHENDGRRIQGWFYRAPDRGRRPAPLVVQIHGGPATLYGWSLMWEWQCLVAAGVSVYACNPRGSQGYGEEFLQANYRDWGDGPMADIMTGVDALIADGLVDAERLGVTGGSYGGYLTSWMVGHTDRFKAAVSCRSVNDLTSQMLSGDIAGPLFGRYEFGANPWQDPELYRLHSPITYARSIRTPLLIQHSENDLRTPITQGEELFTILRSLRRPVRMLRVPEESHELTRSGAPFRRVENIDRIGDWFAHFLVAGKRRLPPV